MNFSVFQTTFRRSQPLNLFEKQKSSFDMLNNSNNNNNNNNNNSNSNRHLRMEYLSYDHKGCLNQHQNSYKLCKETGHPLLNFNEKSTETEKTT